MNALERKSPLLQQQFPATNPYHESVIYILLHPPSVRTNLRSFIRLLCPTIHYNLFPFSLLIVIDSTLEGSTPNAEQNGVSDF